MSEFRPGMWNKLKSGSEYAIGNNMRKSADTGEYTVSIGTQILDFENNVIGYLVLIVRSSIIYENYFSNIKLGRSGRIVAVNDQLKVVMDTDPNEIGEDAPNEYDNIFKSGSVEGNLEYSFNNHKRLGYYKKMKIHPWVVAYAMDEDEIYEINKSIIVISIIIGIISMVFMTLVVFLFTRSIIKPLNIIVDEAKEIASGRLIMHRRKLNRKDELGQLSLSFHDMKYKLIEIIETTLNNANKMSLAANNLAAGNKDLSKRSEDTAANLEETASSMEEISSAISMATNNSVKGNEMMNHCKESIDNATSVVLETVRSMN